MGQDAGRSMLRIYPNPQLDDDLTVRTLPLRPVPIPAASMIAWQRSVETRGQGGSTLA